VNFSYPFIVRPVGTTLLAIGLFLLGVVAYVLLPVASLPAIDFPTIRVQASRPGADPATIAATVAAPLERRLGEISGVTELTSVSSLGSTNITLQFDLSQDIVSAARDVQAALNAAATDLPSDLPTLPTFRKFNPGASPILILALTSSNVSPSAIYDAADSVIAQRISQVNGVADVTVSGADQPAIRVAVNPSAIAAAGVAFEDVRNTIANTNAQGPLGTFNGTTLGETIGSNDQLRSLDDYKTLVIKTSGGNVVRLADVASVEQGTRDRRSGAWFNGEPAVLLIVNKQANANVIDTVDRIRALLPELSRWIPAGVNISILSDRTTTIRASVAHMQLTLAITIMLVMMVVFLFFRRLALTVAAGVAVPLSLAGTCAAMWLAGFSIDNLSLMALVVSVGFVVDDAIVMIEIAFRNLEKGLSPMRAALEGAKQIGFTVISISLSLLAAFIPLLFMGGIVGRLFREFSVTLAFAIATSTIVSLSLTPMVCAHFVHNVPEARGNWLDRAVETLLSRVIELYGTSLSVVLRHQTLTLIVMFATIWLAVDLYIATPKGYLPQDDTGLLFGSAQASPDTSYAAMLELQQRVAGVVRADPAVANVGSSIGGTGSGGALNQGRMFIGLKPIAERGGLTTAQVVDRLRGTLHDIAGIRLILTPAQDLRTGARQTRSQYQFTLWGSDVGELQQWIPKVLERLRALPGLVDVDTDSEQGGLALNVTVDRTAAARLGLRVQDIDDALNDAFAQRQISTIYTERNQYRVILEVDPRFQREPADLSRIYVGAPGNGQVPLSSVTKMERSLTPLAVNHQGQFPSVTLSFNLAPGASLQQASDAVSHAVAEMHLPDSLHGEFAGDTRALAESAGAQPLLLLAALGVIYIVLGVLYESLAHPLTIISTLPSAGLGALLALNLTGTDLTVIAFIGIILLIGIVKKNGIMLVDFALDGERKRGLDPERAIFEACLERFRPILMTTLAALFGAIPLVITSGAGSELRRPLGIAIIGGLLVSQILTLYTTPVIYLLLDKLHRRLSGLGGHLTSSRRH
jgi:hydrophobe/amphiphile efflux-1 (HAE1) family protein